MGGLRELPCENLKIRKIKNVLNKKCPEVKNIMRIIIKSKKTMI